MISKVPNRVNKNINSTKAAKSTKSCIIGVSGNAVLVVFIPLRSKVLDNNTRRNLLESNFIFRFHLLIMSANQER